MSKFVITGGKSLSGTIRVSGSKNAALPMLAASLLTDQECRFIGVPDILDVRNFLLILRGLGAKAEFKEGVATVTCAGVSSPDPDPILVSSMRASVVLLGALLGRLKRVGLAYPGGDILGARPIDVHLRAFRQMNCTVTADSTVRITTKKLRGAEVFAESSVTGTENIILAAVRASGTTVIKLAAQEPHVVALCRFLQSMGARIQGVGTHTLVITGVEKLNGAEAVVIPDMLEAGSFAVLSAATKSDVTIQGVDHQHLDAIYNKFLEIGVSFDKAGSELIIHKPQAAYRSAVIRTGLYPNLATDLQPPFGALATQCAGKTVLHDWIYEGRFGYLPELNKMGGQTHLIDAHQAEIAGPTPLHGAVIKSRDIRSGMTLLIAALVATGDTELDDIHHLDRGYEKLDERLRGLGAAIQRVE